jgi:hypothetical protein
MGWFFQSAVSSVVSEAVKRQMSIVGHNTKQQQQQPSVS